jgi:soluble lytic murein transglycosylase
VPLKSPIPYPAVFRGLLRPIAAVALVLLALHATPGTGKKPEPRSGQVAGSLNPLLPVYPKPVMDALRALKRGLDLYSAGKYQQAVEALPGTEDADGFLLADYAAVWRGLAHLKMDHPEEAARSFHWVRTRFPDSSLAEEALLGECEAQLAMKNAKAALELLDAQGVKVDASVLYYRGLAQEAAGNRPKAESCYLRVYCDFVNADEAASAFKRLQAISPGFQTNGRNLRALLQRAENLLRAGRASDARLLLIRLGTRRAQEAELARWRNVMLAEAEQRLGRATRALGILQGISGSDEEIQARATYLKARCYRTLKRETALLETRDLALRLYPQSPWTERVLYIVATFYDVDNREDRLEAAYGEISKRFPQGRHAERASWKLAVCAWTAQRYEEALARFSRHLQSWPDPDSASASAYWMGRCSERLGDYLSALKLYQQARRLANHSYYGQLAQEAAEAVAQKGAGNGHGGPADTLREALQLLDRTAQPPVTVPEPTGAAARTIERARQLFAADLAERALSELRIAAMRYRRDKAIPYVAARIHEDGGDYFSSIAVLSRAFPSYELLPPASIPDPVDGLLFPTPYLDLVRKHSAASSLDPTIVLGLIRQESAFMAEARSRANARGLMQVLPSTGRQLARRAGIRRYSTARLYQPGTNIALGTRHLSSLLEMFDGKIELALAGYNAGERRVQTWKAQFGETDMAEFVERIPLAETRGYVKRVLTNSAHYRVLLDR